MSIYTDQERLKVHDGDDRITSYKVMSMRCSGSLCIRVNGNEEQKNKDICRDSSSYRAACGLLEQKAGEYW